MKISVILPFRNAAPWINDTVLSILHQTHEDWELLAIHDHSTDGTDAILSKMTDPRIQIIANSGEGIIHALQTGLAHATGVFVTRMDADDLMPKDKLSNLLAAMTPGKKVVTGKVQYFSQKEVSQGYQKYEQWLNERIDRQDHFNHIYRECVIASPNWLVRRDSLLKDQIFNQLKYPEDYDMTFRWQKHGYTVSSVNTVTHLWREHPDRTSRNSEIYDQASFFQLKLDWFRHNETGKSLGIFGTGIKTKYIVEALKDSFDLHVFDHEYQRYTTFSENIPVENPDTCRCDLLLIAVYPENRHPLEKLVANLGYTIGLNAWYV